MAKKRHGLISELFLKKHESLWKKNTKDHLKNVWTRDYINLNRNLKRYFWRHTWMNFWKYLWRKLEKKNIFNFNWLLLFLNHGRISCRFVNVLLAEYIMEHLLEPPDKFHQEFLKEFLGKSPYLWKKTLESRRILTRSSLITSEGTSAEISRKILAWICRWLSARICKEVSAKIGILRYFWMDTLRIFWRNPKILQEFLENLVKKFLRKPQRKFPQEILIEPKEEYAYKF